MIDEPTHYAYVGMWRRWAPLLCTLLRRHRWTASRTAEQQGQRVVIRLCGRGCGCYRARSQSLWTAPLRALRGGRA